MQKESASPVSDPFFQASNEVWTSIQAQYGSPCYVYDEQTLRRLAGELRDVEAPFGFTPRFAMKALPNRNVLRLFSSLGLHFDVSSGYEIARARAAGIPAPHLCLSSQQLPATPAALEGGVRFNACSLRQLEWFGRHFPGEAVGVRINPGVGSGGHVKTNVAGRASAFGIWVEDWKKVLALAESHQLRIVRVHTHIGSGTDPAVWAQVAEDSLVLLDRFPAVTTLNLGGGFKVDRMTGRRSDLHQVGVHVSAKLRDYHARTGRAIHLELEPGTQLTALAGVLLTTVHDRIATGLPEEGGHTFLKLDAGMTEILRPAMYNALHPFRVVPAPGRTLEGAELAVSIAGHCCESGDLITTRDEDDQLVPVPVPAGVAPDDLLLIGGAGAYCSSMCAKNYNSFPQAAEVLLRVDGQAVLIRSRQSVQQIIENEVALPDFS